MQERDFWTPCIFPQQMAKSLAMKRSRTRLSATVRKASTYNVPSSKRNSRWINVKGMELDCLQSL